MYRVTFDQFLQRTTVYERTPVQISPGLRRGAWFSWPIIAVTGLIFQFMPSGDFLRNYGFFYWTQGWMANTWDLLYANRPMTLIISLAIIGLALVLLVLTRVYQRGEIGLHVALFVPVVYAAFSLLCVLVLGLPLLANLIVWIAIGLAVAFCVVIIGFMAIRAAR